MGFREFEQEKERKKERKRERERERENLNFTAILKAPIWDFSKQNPADPARSRGPGFFLVQRKPRPLRGQLDAHMATRYTDLSESVSKNKCQKFITILRGFINFKPLSC